LLIANTARAVPLMEMPAVGGGEGDGSNCDGEKLSEV
jgi:hypothetical protein